MATLGGMNIRGGAPADAMALAALIARFQPFQDLFPWQFWLFVLVCGMVTLLASALLYSFVELPVLKKE